MKYDVFLSKNTKDYKEAELLFNFLENAGLVVFESRRSLPKLGLADYAKAIDDALEQSDNLIVLCSLNESGTGEGDSSSWVYYEWTSFRNELLSKRKRGNLITVLCDGVDVKMLPLGLRKYEAFQLTNIEKSEILGYFKIKPEDSKESIESIDSNNSVASELKLFDLGHHFSMCMFAQMQKKNDFFDLLQDDLNNYVELPWRTPSVILSISPDIVSKEIQDKYGETASDIFSLGNLCGICTTMALFLILGADCKKEFDSTFQNFLEKSNSLGIPNKCVKSLQSILMEKDQMRVANFYKIIRRAVAIRQETLIRCPYCGAINANDRDKCFNCLTPINQ